MCDAITHPYHYINDLKLEYGWLITSHSFIRIWYYLQAGLAYPCKWKRGDGHSTNFSVHFTDFLCKWIDTLMPVKWDVIE